MKIVKGNVTAAYGFKALGKHVGVKKGKKDLAIIVSKKLCSAAAVTSTNKIKAPALEVTKKHLKNGKAQAIIINSGIANVATGKKGFNNALKMCKLVADELGIKKEDVLIASTGIIGKQLPMKLIEKGIIDSKKELSKKNDAAEAILTTDTKKKEIAIQVDNFTIGAIAKGSGMIHPNMATMLCFITTDADLTPDELQKYLKDSVDKTFNMISVDMDTSTSDMVIILSSNKKKVKKKKFQKALTYICRKMAKKIATDGEGATKLITVITKGANSKEDARKISKSVVSSNLVKCAMFGNDPNWGRIMAAIGTTDAKFEEEKMDIYMQGNLVVQNGKQAPGFNHKKISESLKTNKVKIIINLKLGKSKSTAYGCDMTYDYVRINTAFEV